MWSAAVIGREQLHILLHLLSAAGLVWFALHSRHAEQLERFQAVAVWRNEVVPASQPAAPATDGSLEPCHCNATLLQPLAITRQPSASAPPAPQATQQIDAGTPAPVLQPPLSAMQADGTSGITQPRVIVFYHIAALNNWREVRLPSACHAVHSPTKAVDPVDMCRCFSKGPDSQLPL